MSESDSPAGSTKHSCHSCSTSSCPQLHTLPCSPALQPVQPRICLRYPARNRNSFLARLLCSHFNLAFAWTLALACGFHHVGHLLHSLGLHQYAHTELMHGLGAAWVGGALGAAALLGPGRELLKEGALALAR